MATSTIPKNVRQYVGGITAAGSVTVDEKYVTAIDGMRQNYLIVFTTTQSISNGDTLFTNLNTINADYIVYSLSNNSLPFKRTADGKVKANNSINSGVQVALHLPY